MDLESVKRRVEMLETVNKGFHPAVVIDQLAKKYQVSEDSLWADWKRRKKWAPIILALQQYCGFSEMQRATVNAVEKGAWSIFHNGDNDNAKVGALRVILDGVEAQYGILLSSDMLSRLERLEKELLKKKLEENEKI